MEFKELIAAFAAKYAIEGLDGVIVPIVCNVSPSELIHRFGIIFC